jgi:N-sulfoglucosamine sulfohydrolase
MHPFGLLRCGTGGRQMAREVTRREFLRRAGVGAAASGAGLWSGQALSAAPLADGPNILWLTCEDISPNLGCYGDTYAITPNLDKLALRGVRYTNAFSVTGVCAPSRSCLITGAYPWTLGSQHMRSHIPLPPQIKCFTEYLRQAGYYCTNNSKTDYNFRHPGSAWDESSARAHWRNRRGGQRFFSVFNFNVTHENRVNAPAESFLKATARLTPAQRHDPAKADIPPYHPDTPKVRTVWAQYADTITLMDLLVADKLKELEADGLAEDTIVFFFSDHGLGMPRCKFWCYESGTRVPLMIYFPPKYRHLAPQDPGSTVDRLVSFVDFGASVLSLAGVKMPQYMQGKPFLGSQAAEPREYVICGRDRIGPRRDMVRAVRDRKYRYIRNFLPQLPWYCQDNANRRDPVQQVQQELDRLENEGRLSGPPARYQLSRSRPPEELYDIDADPHEIDNLAQSADHREIVERMRAILLREIVESRDLGLMPEFLMHSRATTPYELGLDGQLYPQKKLLAIAEQIRSGAGDRESFLSSLADEEATVRYWAVLGLVHLGDRSKPTLDALTTTLEDSSVDVRLEAADALCRLGYPKLAIEVAVQALEHDSDWPRLQAIEVFKQMGPEARPFIDRIRRAVGTTRNSYVKLMMQLFLEKLGA